MKKQILTFVLITSIMISFAQENPNETVQQNDTSITEYVDISYYGDKISSQPEKTRLNILMPKGIDHPPVILWIGGGAWAYVDRNREMDLCRNFANEGICAIAVGHRLSPALIAEPFNEEGIKHPEHVKDIALAFKWIYENADQYGYSKENIFVGGYSSGAHLSALLAMDNRYLKEVGLSNQMIKGLIPVAGGYDIVDYKNQLIQEDSSYLYNHINPVFGESIEEQIDASPITYIDSLITPLLLISESYSYLFTKSFEQTLIEKNNSDFQVLNVHNKDHTQLWMDMSKNKNNIYTKFIADFIKQKSLE